MKQTDHPGRRICGFRRATISLLASGAGFAAASGPGWAQSAAPAPGFGVVASISTSYDDNLYRLPDGVDPHTLGIRGGSRGEEITSPSLQAQDRMTFGQQEVDWTAGANRMMYRMSPGMDQNFFNYRVDLVLQSGSQWSGRVSEGATQSQTSFADLSGTIANRQVLRNGHVGIDFRPRPDRRVSLIVDRNDGSNSLAQLRQINDFRALQERLEIGVDSPLGHEVVLGVSQDRFEYPNRLVTIFAPIDNSYRQRQVDLGTRYAVTQITSLDLRFGYARRYYADLPDRDFSGPVGSLAISWQPGARWLLRLSVGRDLSAVEDAFRIYSVSTSGQAQISYALTSKLQLSIVGDAARIDYRGVPHNVYTYFYGAPQERRDGMRDLRVGLSWKMVDRLSLRWDETASRRNSTQAGFSFNDLVSQLALEYRVGN